MLEADNDRPLYLQLVDALEITIRKDLSANEKLLSERELTEKFGVSRITVRLALRELESRGLIYKKHGKGTYVSEITEPAVDLSSAYSFTEQMKKMGKKPQTKTITFTKLPANEQIARQLNIKLGDPVFEIERLRSADGLAMMLERSYIPVELFDGISLQDLEQKPLYDIFSDHFGHIIRIAEEEFYAGIALDNEANLLNIKSGSAVLHMIRKTYNTKNRVIEFTLSVARADQFRYKITHQRSPVLDKD